jgi:hypothetical protein
MRDLEEYKFRKIYENIATGIARAGLDRFFEECNDACSALIGHSQDKFVSTAPDADRRPARINRDLGRHYEPEARPTGAASRRGAVSTDDRSCPRGGGDVPPQRVKCPPRPRLVGGGLTVRAGR